MAISITCAQCRHSLTVGDEWAGKRGKCPKCQAVVEVPAPSAAAPCAAATVGMAVGRPNFAAKASPAAAVATSTAAKVGAVRPASRTTATAAAPAAVAPAAAKAGPAKAAPVKPAAAEPAATKANPAAPATPEQFRSRVMAGFVGQVPQARTSLQYRLGILLTALFMVLLPLAYVGIIALACYGVYWHLVHNHVIFGAVRGRGAILALIVYVAPLVIGAIVIVFMIKPLFARPAKEGRRRSVTPDSDPLLFEFVQRICQLVRAPMPRRIDIDCDINASAGFRRGWWSVLVGRDLVLRIGMPLAAGLSLQQFAGVLAHEFGHFSQGTGMRLTYVIRTINHWFVRCVYERDRWDEWLAGAGEEMDIRIGWVLLVARGCVWLTRRILWCLMFLGHVVAGFMLRQMEFDADRYEAHLAGSDTFEATCKRMQQLNLAWQAAQADMSSYYADGRLVDNLPRLLMCKVDRLSVEAHKFLAERTVDEKSGWLDTHPSDADRIAAAKAENAPGAFRSNLPASVLFANFEPAARNVTWDFYCGVFGRTIDPKTLNPTEDLIARQQQEQAADDARDRYFAGAYTGLRPLRLPVLYGGRAQSAAHWRDELVQARQMLEASATAYRAAIEPYDQADTRLVQARQARSILSSNVRLQRDKFDQPPASASEASLQRDRALAQMNRLNPTMEPFEEALGRRMRAAMMLLGETALAARLAEAPAMYQEAQRLLPIVSHVGENHASILELRNCNAVLVALLGHLDGNEQCEPLIREIIDFGGRVREQMAAIRSLFDRIDYPLDHASGTISVSRYLLKMIPPAEEVGAIYHAADELLGGLAMLNARCLGRLCVMAEAVETALGYQRLPPKPCL